MNYISNMLLDLEMDPTIAKYLSIVIMIFFIATICIIANFITKKVVFRVISHIVRNNKFTWDDMLLERRVFHNLSHFVPAIIIYYFASTFPSNQHLIEKGAIAYLIIMGLIVINSVLNAVNDIYQTFEVSKIRPIKGYIQVVNIIVITLGIILIIANLIGKSPLIFLSGIGALIRCNFVGF